MNKFFKDERTHEYVNPVRIVYKTDGVEGEDVLLSTISAQPIFRNKRFCSMKKGASIILDFGREINGSIRVVTTGIAGAKQAKLRIRLGESVSETMAEYGEKNAGNNHTARDIELTTNIMGAAQYGESGFRFVKVDVLDAAEVQIQKIHAVFIYDNTPAVGTFECDDALLNEIWSVGAYTVHLNMQNYVFDGIKRDRLVWIGDMHPEVSTICSVYGQSDCVTRSLDFVKDCTPPDEWMNHIPSYSMWWIIIHHDWYMQNGDLNYLNEQKDYLTKLIDNAITWISTYKLKDDFENFVDWSSKGTDYADAGVMAVFAMGFEAAKCIFKVFNNTEKVSECEKVIQMLRRRKYPYSGNKQIAALVSLAEIEASEKIYEDILSKNLLNGLSTFLGYYTLQAMAKAGEYDSAIKAIKGYWGKMLEFGATTFWEDFDIEWTENAFRIDEMPVKGKKDIHGDFGKFCYQQFRHSLCHGWASGPTPFLSNYVMGVKILEPGCKKVKIEPHMCGLTYVKGAYPTPYGPIKIEHSYNESGELVTKVSAPAQVEIVK